MIFERIGDFTQHWAAHTPERTALVFGAERTSYRALHEAVLRTAAALRAAGIGPGDRVGHMGLNHPDAVVLMQASARVGAVLAPINWRLVAGEVAYILKDAGVRLLLADSAFLPVVEAAAAEAAIGRILLTDPDGPDRLGFRSWIGAHAPDERAHPAEADDVVLQLYTSGTTGFPKGALLTHRSLLGTIGKGALTGEDWSRWDEADVALVAMPLFHIGGTGWALHALEAGATAVILARPDVEAIIRTIAAERVTKAFAVPAVLNMIIQHPASREADLSSLTELLYGASPIPLEVLKGAMATFRNARFIQCYGATETSGTVVYLPPDDHDPAGNARMRGCGRPFPGNEVRIVDSDGRDLPPGEVGEIAVRSVSVMKAYHNNPEATAKAIRDGWYFTGDAGWMDADGYLYIHDRVKDMIVSGAENIYPAEVENALAAHPAVGDVAVIGVPDATWGEAVKAIVVLKAGATATAEELIAHCRRHIAGYKCPKSVDFVAELPRNPSGKILKKELRKPWWEGRDRQVA